MVEYTRRALFIRETATKPASYWRGSRSAASIPEDAMLDEYGNPILSEFGQYILSEN